MTDNEKPREYYQSKTDHELFDLMLEGEFNDDHPWDALSELRGRGTHEIFETAKVLFESNNPLQRARALNVLDQL